MKSQVYPLDHALCDSADPGPLATDLGLDCSICILGGIWPPYHARALPLGLTNGERRDPPKPIRDDVKLATEEDSEFRRVPRWCDNVREASDGEMGSGEKGSMGTDEIESADNGGIGMDVESDDPE
ncbi:hypothetical protein Syun_009957 [Stephania yunnanensis]|uniref:Uncharacterized protein n=1 Tax=Stephania yunnanensis TaxID=152371 RepID=A0AAP0KFI2_9MAGN